MSEPATRRRRFGFCPAERALSAVFDEFPLVGGSAALLAIRTARQRWGEAANLYVRPETGCNAAVVRRPERFLHQTDLSAFLRDEFMHLNDMLAPAFRCIAGICSVRLNLTRQPLAREPYRLSWVVAIDGRLVASEGHVTPSMKTAHWGTSKRTWPFWPEAKQPTVFDFLWRGEAVPRQTLNSRAGS